VYFGGTGRRLHDWIDNFELILSKVGMLCVEESSLRKLKELCPWVEEIDFLSDAEVATSRRRLFGSAISKQ
jgi:hypothetical protein